MTLLKYKATSLNAATNVLNNRRNFNNYDINVR